MKHFPHRKQNRLHRHLWQRSYYDRIIRSRDEYREICQYIAANPQKLHTHP